MINFIKNSLFQSYSFIATNYENFFLRESIKKNTNQDFHSNGFQTIRLNDKFFLPINFEQKHLVNPYLEKILLSENQIQKIINIIFIENNIANFLSELTSFKYNIDHITAYETKHIPNKFGNKKWYANHWHKDGPYSKNNIKLVIPLDDIEENGGGIKIMNSKFSKSFSTATGSDKEFEPHLVFNSRAFKKMLIFAPHLCLHKAGNPSVDITRKQLIIQLNPSPQWSFGNYLYKNQKYIEPKFPILYNFYKGRNAITELILNQNSETIKKNNFLN